ncbi:MAG: InlB B-repeat-containing protein, partial [Lachnospiraceae bacterium]|nr:InlB B-repeat-containing protein [Lachnospiraceae bacterium]
MGIIRKITLFTAFIAIGAALSAFPAGSVYAGTYDISQDNITIICTSNGQTVNGTDDTDPVITGNSDDHVITINTASGCTAKVKLNDVTVNSGVSAAVSITGDGDTVIELAGDNTIQSGINHAGIEKNSSGSLEICGTGSLTANGGYGGAGIGGGDNGSGSNITINGGTVSANGGDGGAGIGGGDSRAGSDIEISGGTVTATALDFGAGIGGGFNGAGSNITIVGGTVIAVGGLGSAGIGGGYKENGSVFRISNDAKVLAAGGAASSFYSGNPGAGAAIGNGGQINDVSGAEIDPNISGLYDTGFIKYYLPGTDIAAVENEMATPYKIITTNKKTISFDPNGGKCSTPTAKTVSLNGWQVLESLPESTRDDYTFDGWFTAKEGGDKITASTVFLKDTTVYAHWTYDPPAPSPSPSPTPSPEPTPSPSPTPSPEPTPSPSPTPSPAPAPEPSPTPSPEPTPSPAPEPTPSPDPDAPKEAVITVSDNKP